MPYIDAEARAYLAGDDSKPRDAGELNYLMTLAAQKALKANTAYRVRNDLNDLARLYVQHWGERYYVFNSIIGAVECCRREFKRRTPDHLWTHAHRNVEREMRQWADTYYRETIAPYEDTKIEQNGDVYP